MQCWCDVGGGGSSGSATLDRLMDTIPFGPKPKIVDLTSDRKLADKVLTCCCITHTCTHIHTHTRLPCPSLGVECLVDSPVVVCDIQPDLLSCRTRLALALQSFPRGKHVLFELWPCQMSFWLRPGPVLELQWCLTQQKESPFAEGHLIRSHTDTPLSCARHNTKHNHLLQKATLSDTVQTRPSVVPTACKLTGEVYCTNCR